MYQYECPINVLWMSYLCQMYYTELRTQLHLNLICGRMQIPPIRQYVYSSYKQHVCTFVTFVIVDFGR